MTTKLNFKQVMIAALTAGAVSAVINSILFFIFHSIGWITDDVFVQPNQPLTVVPVIISSIMPSLVAALVFFLLEKYTESGFRIFSIISIVLMLLSLVAPFKGIQNAPFNYSLALEPMHFVVPLVLLYFINRSKTNNA